VQGHYFEMDAVISNIARDVRDDGQDVAAFSVKYENAKPEDLDMLKRAVGDMITRTA